MKFYYFLFALLLTTNIYSQELFPHNEPASSVPKGVLGVRIFGDLNKETGPANSTYRNMSALRLMYGVTSRFSFMATGTVSNHHSDLLPADLLTHTHNASGSNVNYNLGNVYPYQFNGLHLYGKYRFLTSDGQNRHLRMAAYGEWSNVNAPHDEAEPTLLDDNKGFGAGVICTILKKRFAASLTTGFIAAGGYSQTTENFQGEEIHTEISYGNAVIYNLSFGYLLLPGNYKSYSQTNLNLYLEFMGKSYGEASVDTNGVHAAPQSPLLFSGNYVEIHPGIQAIFNSNLRIDFSVGFPFINQSYARFYPVYMIGIQRYFFL